MKHRFHTLYCILVVFTAFLAEAGVVEISEPLFQGVRHIRREQVLPHKQVTHIIEIELSTPGLRFFTTPGNGPDEPRETWCESTHDFVKRVHAQIGINGNFFINDKESHTELLGLAVSDGDIVSPWDKGGAKYAINIDRNNRATFVERAESGAGTSRTIPEVDLYNALSGTVMLLRDGKIQVEVEGDRHPRTGIGKTAENKLLLLLADGRQPEYSLGMTYFEMAETFLAYDAIEALALDGGGSTTLVIANPEPQVVNVPMPIEMPGGIVLGPPGIERKNGNNLAVFAAPLSENAGKPTSPP